MRMCRQTEFAAVAVLAFGLVTGCSGGGDGGDDGGTGPGNGGFPASAAVTASVNNSFTPRSVDIAAGGRVTWTFNALHNVQFAASENAPEDIPDTGEGQVGRRFSAAGRYGYNCGIHPGMSGTVVVH
jgi:plastocyanin